MTDPNATRHKQRNNRPLLIVGLASFISLLVFVGVHEAGVHPTQHESASINLALATFIAILVGWTARRCDLSPKASRRAFIIAFALVALFTFGVTFLYRGCFGTLHPGSIESMSEHVLIWDDGAIPGATVPWMKRQVRKYQPPRRVLVIVGNRGGQTEEARRIASALPELGIQHVHVSGYCASACTLLFALAPSRSISDDAVLCLHGVTRFRSLRDPASEDSRRYGESMEKVGISSATMDEALRTPSSRLVGRSGRDLTACSGPSGDCLQTHEIPEAARNTVASIPASKTPPCYSSLSQ